VPMDDCNSRVCPLSHSLSHTHTHTHTQSNIFCTVLFTWDV